ncbi:MAG: hypothetical protein WA197_05690 [Candidatus Acidiferrales bacterium]
MTTASQDIGATAVRVETGSPAGHSTIFKLSCATAFALMLALAPTPAFAQHGGGGGGGGGAHGGGGGGGGSHGGGGGGGHVGGGSGGGGSHAGATSAPSGGSSHGGGASASGANNSGGHWWNPFHSGASASGRGSNVAGGNGNSGTNGSPEHFAAGNNTWQEPPAPAGHASPAVNHYAPASATRPVVVGKQPAHGATGAIHEAGVVAGPPHVFPPTRGRGGYPNYFYNPYPYFGFGWGGGLWWGGFYPCDPFWGCYGYGYGGGYGLYGGSFGGDYGADLSYNSQDDEGSSQEPNTTLFAAPAGEQVGGETSQQPYVILYLKDGSSYAVSDYWLAGGKLHYVTSYGGENVIDESQLDLQRTVNENATRGVDFTLRPEPAGNGETAPAGPAPETRPPAPQP